jgi:hypothetical protein
MIDEQLIGRLIEAVDNLKEDGKTRGSALERLSDRVEDLRLSINGLSQTTQSLSNQIVRLDAEKCDERLTALELKAKRYDGLLGSAGTFIWRVAGGLVISALSGGAAAVFILKG